MSGQPYESPHLGGKLAALLFVCTIIAFTAESQLTQVAFVHPYAIDLILATSMFKLICIIDSPFSSCMLLHSFELWSSN